MSRILRKAAAERSAEEGRLLAESEDLVTELQGRSRRREGLKRRQEEASPAARPGLGRCGARAADSRGRGRALAGRGRGGRHDRPRLSRQVCDDPEELRRKVRELAGAVRNAKYLVVYTGAGISTVRRPGGRGPGRAGVGRPLLGGAPGAEPGPPSVRRIAEKWPREPP